MLVSAKYGVKYEINIALRQTLRNIVVGSIFMPTMEAACTAALDWFRAARGKRGNMFFASISASLSLAGKVRNKARGSVYIISE